MMFSGLIEAREVRFVGFLVLVGSDDGVLRGKLVMDFLQVCLVGFTIGFVSKSCN